MADDIIIPDDFTAFTKLQSFIISTIEKSGDYWTKEFKRRYNLLEDYKKEKEFIRVCDALQTTILQMINVEECKKAQLDEIFIAGMNGIWRQLEAEADTIVSIFKSGVRDLVSDRKISVGEIHSHFKKGPEVIYDDGQFYYFPKSTLVYIQEQLRFDRKAVLFIKQSLAADGFVKQYRTTGTRRCELDVDIFIGTCKSRERLSVFAVKCNFWDEVGGISLREE